MANSKTLQTENILKKTLRQGKMHLDLEVSSDIKTDLKDFRALLVEGINILDKELEKFKK